MAGWAGRVELETEQTEPERLYRFSAASRFMGAIRGNAFTMNCPPWVRDLCPKATAFPKPSPGQRPGKSPPPKPRSALKGPNHDADRFACPFRAVGTIDTPSSGRCPGLGLVTPFGRPCSWSQYALKNWKTPLPMKRFRNSRFPSWPFSPVKWIAPTDNDVHERFSPIQNSIRKLLRRPRLSIRENGSSGWGVFLAACLMVRSFVSAPPVFAADWPQFQHDAQRTGASEERVEWPFRIRWCWLGPDRTIRNRLNTGADSDPELRPGDILASKVPLPARVPFAFSGHSQPVIVGSRVFIGDVDGRVYAIDVGSGVTLWSRPFPGGTFVAGVSVGEMVVFASVTGVVRAFDISNGDLAWEHTGFGSFLAAPLVDGKRIALGSTDRHVHAFDEHGRHLWSSPDLGAPVAGGLASDGESVFVGAENMTFHRLSWSEGRVQAQRKVAGQTFATAWPVVAGGRIYVEAAPIPAIGSEYVGEEVMAGSRDVPDEMRRWREFLRGEGGYRDASRDWKHLTVLNASDLSEPFLVPSGPFDGCGQPPDAPAVDVQGNVWTYFKSRWSYLARPCGFGTKHQVDLGIIDPRTGDRIVVDRGRRADNAWYAWETDNLYAMSFAGPTLLLRQNFRGTVAVRTDTAEARALSNLYHIRDGGTWRGDIQYAENYERGDRVPRASMKVPYARPAVATAAGMHFLVEDFCLTAVEAHR